MSIPNFPHDIGKIDWEQALSMVVASIAMEELALSHILNAEGEKLQYVLGTLYREQPRCTSIEDILRINESIGGILDKVETNQMLLKGKLEQVIKAHQQHPKKVATYHSKPGFCWYQGKALPWCGEGEADLGIALPAGGTVLVSYSLAFAQACGERKVVVLMQRVRGTERETLGVAEAQACYGETEISLCGCLVVPPRGLEDCSSELQFVLSAPCSISATRGTVTITTL